jgi:hypothetical protein
MMNKERFIADFAATGTRIAEWLRREDSCPSLSHALQQSLAANSWFTPEGIRMALDAVAMEMLKEEKLRQWLAEVPVAESPQKIGIVMAGNIPLVGFHDFLCVLAAGHLPVGKLSGKDSFLLPAVAQLLCEINPQRQAQIAWTRALPLGDIAALIVTGSDSTAGLFEKQAPALPHLIRHHRNSVAVLEGNETPAELQVLATDITSYFGMGCRNVSLLMVPRNYNWHPLTAALAAHRNMMRHEGYAHNYRYQKAQFLLQGTPCIDATTVLLHENASLRAPIAVVHYQQYASQEEALRWLAAQKNRIQCITGKNNRNFCTFGTAQRPALRDYADGINTLQWLAAITANKK